ncbi:MAG: substrate-binding domain-containing protein [Desulfurococcales archaeon]|nr:substrate-binding domain-containing protein [Desulfurococcales archaeon]
MPFIFSGKRFIVMLGAFIFLVFLALQYGNSSVTRIRVATATTLYDTGLLELLSSEFEKKEQGYAIDFLPIGTGEALKRAEMSDACIVITHDPALEYRYLSKGIIGEQKIIAVNHFIVAGPASDPANVSSSTSIIEAFKKIFEAGERGEAVFVSRGDNSGTHNREKLIWRKTLLSPSGRSWYLESGSGMANTLLLASEKKAYVFSDIGTFLFLKSKNRIPGLELLYYNTSDPLTLNIYSAYLVSSCKGGEAAGALLFLSFLESEGQVFIGDFTIMGGTRLFIPAREYEAQHGDIFLAWKELSMMGGEG